MIYINIYISLKFQYVWIWLNSFDSKSYFTRFVTNDVKGYVTILIGGPQQVRRRCGRWSPCPVPSTRSASTVAPVNITKPSANSSASEYHLHLRWFSDGNVHRQPDRP